MQEGRTRDLVGTLLLGLGVALVAGTVVVATGRPLPPAVFNDRFDIAILTAATLVAAAVAALDWSRSRVTHDPGALLRAAAFTVLAMHTALSLLLGVVGADAAIGGTLADPGQLPLVAGVVSRGVAAFILVLAGWAALTQRVPSSRPWLVLVVPASAVLAFLLVATVARDSLPELGPPAVLDALQADPGAPLGFAAAPALLVVQSLIGAAFLVAAHLAYRAFLRSHHASDALLAAGLMIAAFSQVHGAIHPGSYSGVVTSADLLRLAFSGVLLVGVVAESRQDLADLRLATLEVRRLAAERFAAAGLEERARLAREIHDGLAQDLWYAKLKQSRLAQLVAFEGEPKQLSEEVGDAIDAALAEARNAVAAMREGVEAGPLVEMIERHVNDFADRFALRAEFSAEGPPPAIGPRAKAELLRIVQEALTNVRKHADATMVRVSVHSDRDLRLTVSDNGRGFRADRVPAGFGLDSMRQRAEIIGATLRVASEPQGGTRVELVLPNANEGR